MKNKLLLPHSCRMIGWIMLPFAITLLIMVYSYNYSIPLLRTALVQNDGMGSQKIDLSGTIALIGTYLSLFLVAFARERKEDEYVMQVRLKALQISVYANYLVLAIATIFLYSLNFMMAMELNLFTILVLFIIIYYYQLYLKPRLLKSKTA